MQTKERAERPEAGILRKPIRPRPPLDIKKEALPDSELAPARLKVRLAGRKASAAVPDSELTPEQLKKRKLNRKRSARRKRAAEAERAAKAALAKQKRESQQAAAEAQRAKGLKGFAERLDAREARKAAARQRHGLRTGLRRSDFAAAFREGRRHSNAIGKL